ncbi:MAG: hypothetical protein AAGF79_02550 [Pseudomonadota bacterium]
MRVLVIVFVVALIADYALAQPELRGPRLGAASNFGQSWQPKAVTGGEEVGIQYYRDEVIWDKVEQLDGRLRFGSMREAYPKMLSAREGGMMLLGYSGHPNWDGGKVPQTEAGQAAFAAYHGEIVARFDLIDAVEIGNEFNSHEFADFAGWPADLTDRAEIYARLLARAAAAVRAERPGIRVLGGAAHSIPVAWAEVVMAAGAGAHMDAFVLHPYTTEPEQFARQVARLRQVPGLEDMPLAVTEFGTLDGDAAPGYLMRYYCQMALAGVHEAVWYPFSPRGDGLAPLVEADGTVTGVGASYALILNNLQGQPVEDVAPDPFTYACQFGDAALVVWGAPRFVTLAPGLLALDPLGRPVQAPALSRQDPLLILGDGAVPRLGETVNLGPQQVLYDSYDLFPQGGSPDLFVRRNGDALPLTPRPGQERDGVPWTPYLGFDQDGSIGVGAGWAVPSTWGAEDPLDIVYRYTAPAAQIVVVEILAAPSAQSDDGITLALERNGEVLTQLLIRSAEQLVIPDIPLEAGDVFDIALGPNANSTGDHTDLRVTIRRTP